MGASRFGMVDYLHAETCGRLATALPIRPSYDSQGLAAHFLAQEPGWRPVSFPLDPSVFHDPASRRQDQRKGQVRGGIRENTWGVGYPEFLSRSGIINIYVLWKPTP